MENEFKRMALVMDILDGIGMVVFVLLVWAVLWVGSGG